MSPLQMKQVCKGVNSNVEVVVHGKGFASMS